MWHRKFANNLRDMGFRPTKTNYNLWIRDRGDHHECIAVITNDILVFSKEPEKIIEPRRSIFGYTMKGVGVPEYYNGADIAMDKTTCC